MSTGTKFGAYLILIPASFLCVFSVSAATTVWWDTNYSYRQNINVTTGANTPDKGYIDYTARIPSFDTQSLISAGQMQIDCDDLRILFFNGTIYQELERHVIGCNTSTTDIRFALSANIAVSSSDDNYYMYYNNSSAGAPIALSPTNVYLWYDDASVNRSTSYTHGRVDPWHGTSWDDSLVHNAAGYYTYDTGDNFTSGYRRAVDERDVYIEAEFFHTGCYQLNQTTGVLTRGIIASGSGATETSNHYYSSNRGEFPGCSATGYTHDGDIMKTDRGPIAVDGVNPPDITANQWRRQGLASWLVNPTNLSFWDEDNSNNWAALGFPDNANLHASGTDATDHESRGFTAVMMAQDTARLRNILIRRYIDPEPTLVLTLDLQADLDITKDDGSLTYTPGGTGIYTITVTNNGPSNVSGASINDVLPHGVTFNPPPGPVTCVANGTASCGTITTGSNGGPGFDQDFFDATGVNINAGVGNSVVYTIRVQFSPNMGDYMP